MRSLMVLGSVIALRQAEQLLPFCAKISRRFPENFGTQFREFAEMGAIIYGRSKAMFGYLV
jgi:hypothetical protein